MLDLPLWFLGSILGAIVALMLIAVSAYAGIGTLLLNIVAFACFAIPVIAGLRDDDLHIG